MKQYTNWVANRFACRTEAIFMRLREVVEFDVAEVVKLDSKFLSGRTFKVFPSDNDPENEFDVVVNDQRTRHSSNPFFVRFRREGRVIRVLGYTNVADGDLKLKFTVLPTWDEETNSCRLWIDDNSYDLWQITQRALANFFSSNW